MVRKEQSRATNHVGRGAGSLYRFLSRCSRHPCCSGRISFRKLLPVAAGSFAFKFFSAAWRPRLPQQGPELRRSETTVQRLRQNDENIVGAIDGRRERNLFHWGAENCSPAASPPLREGLQLVHARIRQPHSVPLENRRGTEMPEIRSSPATGSSSEAGFPPTAQF